LAQRALDADVPAEAGDIYRALKRELDRATSSRIDIAKSKDRLDIIQTDLQTRERELRAAEAFAAEWQAAWAQAVAPLGLTPDVDVERMEKMLQRFKALETHKNDERRASISLEGVR